MAGVALGDIDLALRGRRGTWWHAVVLDHWLCLVAGVALGDIDGVCVAGVALGDIDLHFAWQAWHLWHWTGSGGALGSQLTPWTPRLFAWQAWHLAALTFTLRGRRGTW